MMNKHTKTFTLGNKDCEPKDIWLNVFCPDGSCLLEEERIKMKAFCDDSGKKRDLWLDVFCPEDKCDIFETSQLP